MREIREPDECETMAEVRAGVDDVDRRIVDLIARRFAFMNAAARIKPDRASVRDELRKAEVISKVEAAAIERGMNATMMRRLYEELIESSIAYEFEEFDRLRSA
jgi:isochorismate pyruvate lyase